MFQLLRDLINRFWYLFFLLLIIVLLFIFKISLIEISETLSELSVLELVILVLTFLIISIPHIFSKKYLLKSLGENCRYFNLVAIHFSSMAAHYTTPAKIGYPVTVFLLNKLENVTYSKSITLISVELIISTWLCFVISLFGATNIVYGQINLVSIIVILFAPVIVVLVIYKISVNFSKNPLSQSYIKFINHLKLLSWSQLMIYTCILSLIRILDGFSLYIITLFYAESISLWQSIVATSSAFLIGAISMVPMGLGTRDVSLFAFLVSFNLSEEVALGIITVQRILSTGLGFILGIIFAAILGVKNIPVNDAGK